MYIYKALVGSLPMSNKLKLVQLINQHSDQIIEPIDLSAYSYGVIYQSQAMYVGVFLVKEIQNNDGKEFVISHFAIASNNRGRGYGSGMISLVIDELKKGDHITIMAPESTCKWKINKLLMWGFEAVNADKIGDSAHVAYQLCH